MSFTIQIGSTAITASAHYNRLRIYNCLVDVIRLTKVNTSTGLVEIETVLHTNLACAIRWVSGKEHLRFDKQTWYRDATLRCRYCDIDVKDRIRFGGKDFEIVDVRDYKNLGKVLMVGIKRIGQ